MMDAYEEYLHIPGSSSALSETVDSIAQSIASGKERALISFVGNTPVACVRYSFKNGLYFYRLSVRQAWQGSGFAKSLLIHLESLAMAERLTNIWCKVRYSVPRNVYLYQSLGYEKFDEEFIRKENGVILRVWMMKKELNAQYELNAIM